MSSAVTTLLNDLGLNDCVTRANCTPATDPKCKALVKACMKDIASIDCDHVKKFANDVYNMIKKPPAPSPHNQTAGPASGPDDFADGWNQAFGIDGVYLEDVGEATARLNSNLQCFSTEMNRLASPGATKLKVPGDDLQKGLLKGLKAIPRVNAALVAAGGFVLLMVLCGILRYVKKDTPLFDSLVALLVLGAVVATIMLV